MNSGLKGVFQGHVWRKKIHMKTVMKRPGTVPSELFKGNTSPLGATVCNEGIAAGIGGYIVRPSSSCAMRTISFAISSGERI